jgi:hypothetical protein
LVQAQKELRAKILQLKSDFELMLLPLLQNNPVYSERIEAALRSIDRLGLAA